MFLIGSQDHTLRTADPYKNAPYPEPSRSTPPAFTHIPTVLPVSTCSPENLARWAVVPYYRGD